MNDIGGNWHGTEINGIYFSNFGSSFTACWRCYVATWSLLENKLFLTDISATDAKTGKDLSMLDVFGLDKLPAFWFSGELSSPLGNIIYGLYEPIFEKDIVWVFDSGTLVKKFIRENSAPEFSSLKVKLEEESSATPPFAPRLAELLDKLAFNEDIFDIPDSKIIEMEKSVRVALNSLLKIKSQYIKNYEPNIDPEFDALRDAWQNLTHPKSGIGADERRERIAARHAYRFDAENK